MWKDYQWGILFTPVLLGFLSSFLAPMKNAGVNLAARPPKYTFIIIWTILYILYGVAFNFAIDQTENNKQMKDLVISLYSILLFLLFIWPFVYNYSGKKNALYLILFTLMLTFACAFVSPIYSQLALSPLIGWVIFALMLNFHIIKY